MTSDAVVCIRALGGTISMRGSAGHAGGARPTESALAVLRAVPALKDVARFDVKTLTLRPSPSIGIADLLRYRRDFETACRDGARGVVVLTGTDTMEEAAYLLDLTWQGSAPLVLTGAMRTADAPGADGPANLMASVVVAMSPEARGRGCLLVMNDEIHAAAAVRKVHTTSVAAFQSMLTGPLGYVHERHASFVGQPRRLPALEVDLARDVPKVGLLRVTLGADTLLLEQAAQLYDGLVVESLGGGHVPEWWAAPLISVARRIPTVLASRTGNGHLLTRTYGFAGSETELLAGGLISAGYLDGLKARILLITAMLAATDRSEIEAIVTARTALTGPLALGDTGSPPGDD